MIIFCLFLGGVGRAVVGSGKGPAWLGRWSVYPPIALLSAYVGLGYTPLLFWAALVASLSMGLGYTQWESWKHMSLRLGLPALAVIAPIIFFQGLEGVYLLYPAIAVICGLLYPIRQNLFSRLPVSIFSISMDTARYMEFVAGTCILGGLSLFSL